MDRSDSVAKVSAALVLACGELENVVAEKINPHFRSKYAALPDLLDAVRPVLTKHGLAVVQMATSEDAAPYRIGVETILLHSSGEYLSNTILVTPQKNDPQGAGSALTYCRRYALAAALGIGQEDDDGNHASQRQEPARRAATPASRTAPPVDADSPLAEVWPPDWIGERLMFGKHAEKTWADFAEGGIDSGRHQYLQWLVQQTATTGKSKQNQDRANLVLAYIERDIPKGIGLEPSANPGEDF